jgi:NAD-dependent dihydropyrimidine dehydrogenase PreA subunit
MSNNSKNLTAPWHGIARAEIDWHPTVVDERCIGCGLCVTSCGRGVFAFDYDTKKAVVANPLQCMVGCSTCGTICSQDAIEFPSQGYVRHLIKQKKILRQTKQRLRENREKYDINLRDLVHA